VFPDCELASEQSESEFEFELELELELATFPRLGKETRQRMKGSGAKRPSSGRRSNGLHRVAWSE